METIPTHQNTNLGKSKQPLPSAINKKPWILRHTLKPHRVEHLPKSVCDIIFFKKQQEGNNEVPALFMGFRIGLLQLNPNGLPTNILMYVLESLTIYKWSTF